MLHPDVANLRDLEDRQVALAEHKLDGRVEDVILSRLDMLLPAETISTVKYAREGYVFPNRNREPAKLDLDQTPYLIGIMETMDRPGVRKVAVQGSSRVGKTTSWEVKMTKHLKYGPVMNITFFMQTKDDLVSYVDERLDWTMTNIEEIAARIDPSDSRNSRTRYMVGGTLLQLFPATQSTLRGKAAPMMGIDEVDGMSSRVLNSIETLIDNRQRDYKGDSLAYFASHPDAGPTQGISKIIANGVRHLWQFPCPHCLGAVSHAKEAEDAGMRMNWNVAGLMKRAEEMDRIDFLDMVDREARLVCPHCEHQFDDEQRKAMSNRGAWLQPHQKLTADGVVEGVARIAKSMGFIIHAFMSPFVRLGDLAVEWAKAKLTFDATGDDKELREVEVKSLGMVYGGGVAEEQIDGPKVVQARLGAPYALKTVPRGVQFLTAFVDPQGDRFEVRVVGWDVKLQSWLIDAYSLKQWPGFDNIDPGNRLKDWDIIEQAVINQTYPLVDNPQLVLPIARTCVNSAGTPGSTDKARQWNANILARAAGIGSGRIIEPWRIRLFIGKAQDSGETYGRARQVEFDDQNRPLATPVYEVTANVHAIKRIIARRMKIEETGTPGRMHLPFDLSRRYVAELTSETLINGQWVARGRNETWDGWVACDLARAGLRPDRAELWQDGTSPPWATPMPRGELLGGEIRTEASYYDRLAELNAPD